MQGSAKKSACFRQPRAPKGLAVVLTYAAGLAGCAVGPDFAHPDAPPAARYTRESLRAENAGVSDTVQHIDLGREIKGNWWTLFHSDAIDQLVTQALDHVGSPGTELEFAL